ncbi:MAG TPA: hypothetical protein VK190_11355 [Pseudoneobacillus sp.]|nr:hypothetical protein [Pseudoneobacillus sp.]
MLEISRKEEIILSNNKTQLKMMEELIKEVWHMVDYWDDLKGNTQRENLEGLAFSFLSMLDNLRGNHANEYELIARMKGKRRFPINGSLSELMDIVTHK